MFKDAEAENKLLVARILEAIRSIEYGAVQITIHDSRVVQIEKTEKIKMGGNRSNCICS